MVFEVLSSNDIRIMLAICSLPPFKRAFINMEGKGFKPFKLENSAQLIDVMCISQDKDGTISFGSHTNFYGDMMVRS